MMAVANLLSHPTVTDDEIESGEFQGIRRCAKDLGRVIALAALAGRDDVTEWVAQWHVAVRSCFPATWRELARRTGHGFREMLADDDVMEQARKTLESGLLKGKGFDVTALRAFGERALGDAISVFESLAREEK